MFARNFSKLSPAIAVTALLCLGAAAPSPQIGAPPPRPLPQPRCDEFSIAVPGDSRLVIPDGSRVEQPLPAGMSVAACSLGVRGAPVDSSGGMTFVRVELWDWDSGALAPDPDAIALRRLVFGGFIPQFSLVPPVVTSSVPGVAEPPKPQVSIRVAWSPDTSLDVYFTPDGPAERPAAVELTSAGTYAPLPGPHPVLAHFVCDGDTGLAALRIVQSVSRTDVIPFPP